MTWQLVIEKGSHKGEAIPVSHSPFWIGRDERCQLRTSSEKVGDWHCALVVRDEVLIDCDGLTDLGTFINGEAIEGKKTLSPGDHLKAGPLRFQLEWNPDKKPKRSANYQEEVAGALLMEMDEEEEAPRARGVGAVPSWQTNGHAPDKMTSPPGSDSDISDIRPVNPSLAAAAILRHYGSDYMVQFRAR